MDILKYEKYDFFLEKKQGYSYHLLYKNVQVIHDDRQEAIVV